MAEFNEADLELRKGYKKWSATERGPKRWHRPERAMLLIS
jgi:hypothetical protein